MNRVIVPSTTPSDPLGSVRTHVIAPLLAFVAFAIVFESTRIDVWLADAVYRWEGDTWTLRRDPLVRDLLHDAASRVVDAAYALVALACAASFFVSHWRPYRWTLVYL